MASEHVRLRESEGNHIAVQMGETVVHIPKSHARNVADALAEYCDKEEGKDKPTPKGAGSAHPPGKP